MSTTAAPDTFPVDDITLDLLHTALHPGPEAERTSLYDLLELLSDMHHGPLGEPQELSEGIVYRPGVRWSPHDVIDALIGEVCRLRNGGPSCA